VGEDTISRYHDVLRAQAPHQRLAQSIALTRMVRQLAEAGIRQRHPGASDAEVRVRLTVDLYGRDIAAATFRRGGDGSTRVAEGSVPSDDVVTIARRLGKAIEQAGGAYLVGGSIASSLQGEPRSTSDIDVVLELPPTRVDHLVDLLGPDFEVDIDLLRTCLQSGGTCNIFYIPTVTKIDLFARGSDRYDQTEFSRRRPVQVDASGETLVVASPEDTVLRKLLGYQQEGGVSERQWRDVVEILRVSGPEMDSAHLSAWADRLGLTATLERAKIASRPHGPKTA
jgi:hypothetical protein